MKRLLRIIMLLMMLCSQCLASDFIVDDDEDAARPEAAEILSERAFAPMDWSLRIAPNRPDPAAYSDGNMRYHDDSLDVHVETFTQGTTLCYAMYVTLTDISQFRTGTGSHKAPYSQPVLVSTMAKKFHAVCAVSGDYFGYHSEGIVFRNGRQLRMRPVSRRDTLIVDARGDLHIITATTAAKWQAYREGGGTVLHTFTFGPALVVDGEINENAGHTVLNLGKDKRIQRTAIGQLGPLSYVFVTCDGPQNARGSGMTVEEMAGVMQALGCTNAYNLDGASSSTLVMNNVKINARGSKKRPVGDCIWFATLVEK